MRLILDQIERLSGSLEPVKPILEQLALSIAAVSDKEHHGDGTHADITAESVDTDALTADEGTIAALVATTLTLNGSAITYTTGTWTPVIGGSGGTTGQTYSRQAGHYIKIGAFVFVYGEVTLTTEGTITGNAELQGLPFTSEASTGSAYVFSLQWTNLATNWVNVIGDLGNSRTAATLRGATAAAATNTTILTAADIGNTTSIVFNGCYRAA